MRSNKNSQRASGGEWNFRAAHEQLHLLQGFFSLLVGCLCTFADTHTASWSRFREGIAVAAAASTFTRSCMQGVLRRLLLQPYSPLEQQLPLPLRLLGSFWFLMFLHNVAVSRVLQTAVHEHLVVKIKQLLAGLKGEVLLWDEAAKAVHQKAYTLNPRPPDETHCAKPCTLYPKSHYAIPRPYTPNPRPILKGETLNPKSHSLGTHAMRSQTLHKWQ